MSDIFFNHGVHQAERRRTKNPNIKSPTYLYLFSFEGMSSPIKRLMSAILGVPNNIRGKRKLFSEVRGRKVDTQSRSIPRGRGGTGI